MAELSVAFGRLYAIELARRPPDLGGLVLESGLASPSEQWKFVAEANEIGCRVEEIEAAMAVHFDHRAKLAGYAGPVLVLHAEQDRLVPKSHAERLHVWAGDPDTRSVCPWRLHYGRHPMRGIRPRFVPPSPPSDTPHRTRIPPCRRPRTSRRTSRPRRRSGTS